VLFTRTSEEPVAGNTPRLSWTIHELYLTTVRCALTDVRLNEEWRVYTAFHVPHYEIVSVQQCIHGNVDYERVIYTVPSCYLMKRVFTTS